jgi:archaellum component FlaF (FlaF/FlaG flagellin family)
MGFSHIVTAGVVLVPLFTIVMAVPGVMDKMLEINQAALDSGDLENSILNTNFEISNLWANGTNNLVYFNVTNTGTTSLWDYDNFDLLVTYKGVVGSTERNVTESISYSSTVPTGVPIMFDSATGFSGSCVLVLGCSFSHTVTTSGSDRILIVGVNTASAALTSVSYGGQAMTNIRSDNNGASAHTSLWYLKNPPTGTNTVTMLVSIVSNVAAGAISFTGVDQTTPIATHNGATGTSTTPSVSVTTSTDESWLVDVVGTVTGPMTTDVGQVERWDTVQTTTRGAGSTEATSTTGTFTMAWTNEAGSNNWAISAAALKPSGTPCCVSIKKWNIADISNDHIDPNILNTEETAWIRAKTSYQIVDNGTMAVTFSTDNGVEASSFVVP